MLILLDGVLHCRAPHTVDRAGVEAQSRQRALECGNVERLLLGVLGELAGEGLFGLRINDAGLRKLHRSLERLDRRNRRRAVEPVDVVRVEAERGEVLLERRRVLVHGFRGRSVARQTASVEEQGHVGLLETERRGSNFDGRLRQRGGVVYAAEGSVELALSLVDRGDVVVGRLARQQRCGRPAGAGYHARGVGRLDGGHETGSGGFERGLAGLDAYWPTIEVGRW